MLVGEILSKAEKDLRQKFLPLFLAPELPQAAELFNYCEPILIEIMDALGELWLREGHSVSAELLRARTCGALFSFPGGAYSRAIEYSLIGRIDHGRGGDESLFGKYVAPDGCPLFLKYALNERSQYWQDVLSKEKAKPAKGRGRPRNDARSAAITGVLSATAGWKNFRDDDLIELAEKLDRTEHASAPSRFPTWSAYVKAKVLEPKRVIETLMGYEPELVLAAKK